MEPLVSRSLDGPGVAGSVARLHGVRTEGQLQLFAEFMERSRARSA